MPFIGCDSTHPWGPAQERPLPLATFLPACTFPPMKLLSRFAVFLFVLAGDLDASPIIRETGAIYLSDFGEKPLRLRVLRPAPCYFDIKMTRYAGTLRFPQVVQ